MEQKLAIIGAGNMARSIIAGVLRTGLLDAGSIIATNRSHNNKLEQIHDVWGVGASYHNAEAAAWADTVILAVKPVDMKTACAQIRDSVGGKLIVSVAAGVGIAQIAGWLGDATQPIVRVMPNTPAQVGEGMSAWAANENVTVEQSRTVEQLLGALGRQLRMEREDLLDQVTAVSGSGPAYLFYLAEALIASGRNIGLSEEESRELVLQTIWGAAKMLRDGESSPSSLRQAVTSKGGTTEAALAVFAQGDLDGVISRGVQAAYHRGGEIRRALAAADAPQPVAEPVRAA